ncbi:MAG: menaquinone biosynthesis decarboxylase [Deltaproteobacteria bacterium]|nr:MAG: menaquinone biosynthesis decarboxylase [Deltaproteobacteria bacterium]
MAFSNLQDLMTVLERQGQLARITEPLNPRLEITEVTDRVVKQKGPALLFQRPSGYDIPVLTNVYGTLERIRIIFGIGELDDLGERLAGIFHVSPPGGFMDKLRFLPRLKEAADIFPRRVRKAPCQEVVETGDFDLTRLPVLTCWPQDAGPFITLPVVVTRHPVTGKRNVGMYRMQVYDGRTTGMHWHIHKGGAADFRASDPETPLPVAVAIGPDPITTYCATAPVPEGMDEFILAGFLRRKPVDLVKCVTCDLEVPAQSQFVLEGYVQPGETRREGPFGDHTGFYSPADDYAVFHLTAVTRRKDPVYPATVVGVPPMEDQWLGKMTERLFLPLLRQQFPEIVDMNLPVEGCFHNLCFISIDKRYPGHAHKIMHAIWGMGQMMFTKMIFVFDRDVDVQNTGEVLFHLGNNLDPARDTVVVRGPVDALDHAADLPHLGAKMGFDCTRKGPGEGYHRTWPDLIRMDPAVKDRIDDVWSRLGL